MRDRILTIFLSAAVSAVVTFLTVSVMQRNFHAAIPENLAVKSLKVAETITIQTPDQADEAVVLRNDGLVFAKGKVITEHFLGTQFSGHLLVGNRVLVSPNDLANDAPENFQFLGEFGINQSTGSGELLIRSPEGGNHVETGVESGQFAQITFDQNDLLNFLVYDNLSKGTQLFAEQKTRPEGTSPERSQAAPPVAGPPITLPFGDEN